MAIDNAAGTMAGLKSGSNVGSQGISGVSGAAGMNQANAAEGAEFKRALEQIAAQMPQTSGVPNNPIGGQTSGLAANQVLKSSMAPSLGPVRELKFSNHAVERMRSRGIAFQPEEMNRIAAAISKAAAKGAKDTLVLSGENALIVSVKNSTVVTVMDRTAMKENVFTNIDSTVVI